MNRIQIKKIELIPPEQVPKMNNPSGSFLYVVHSLLDHHFLFHLFLQVQRYLIYDTKRRHIYNQTIINKTYIINIIITTAAPVTTLLLLLPLNYKEILYSKIHKFIDTQNSRGYDIQPIFIIHDEMFHFRRFDLDNLTFTRDQFLIFHQLARTKSTANHYQVIMARKLKYIKVEVNV